MHRSTRLYSEAQPSWIGKIGILVAVSAAYFLAARLGLALLTQPDGVAYSGPLRASPRERSSLLGSERGYRSRLGYWPQALQQASWAIEISHPPSCSACAIPEKPCWWRG
jgi:hypothetical protein